MHVRIRQQRDQQAEVGVVPSDAYLHRVASAMDQGQTLDGVGSLNLDVIINVNRR